MLLPRRWNKQYPVAPGMEEGKRDRETDDKQEMSVLVSVFGCVVKTDDWSVLSFKVSISKPQ